MTIQTSFKAEKTFSDRGHFPYPFARSGELSKKQATLLEQHGRAYKDLESGEREPITPEEVEFLRFCHNEKAAETEHEKIWQMYQRHLVKRNFYISMGREDRSNSSGPADEPIEVEMEDSDA